MSRVIVAIVNGKTTKRVKNIRGYPSSVFEHFQGVLQANEFWVSTGLVFMSQGSGKYILFSAHTRCKFWLYLEGLKYL